jgi:hypothetical protein
MREIDRLHERLDIHETAETRAALDQLAALVNRLDARMESLDLKTAGRARRPVNPRAHTRER